MNDDAKPLIFLHIPKTAGTSLIELVSRNFRHDEISRIADIHRPVLEITSDIEVAIAEGRRFICGHFPYAAVAPLGDDVEIFTMLRDPIDRIVSLYKFWRGRDGGPRDSAASRFACQIARSMSFGEFLACDHPLIVSATRDEMCKALGAHVGQNPSDLDTAELFASARSTLSSMAFGMVGDLDRSLRVLSRRLRLNLSEPVRLNTTDDIAPPAIAPDDRYRITLGNLADTMLHDHAAKTFERRAAASDLESLHHQIGERALSEMVADDRGGFIWDASMRVAGLGWNDREALDGGTCYRFTSTPETVIHLPNRLADRAFVITVDAGFFNNEGLLDSRGAVAPSDAIGFELNGHPVDVQARPEGEGGAVFRIAVARGQVAGPILSLVLKSRFGLSPSVFGSPDKRNLLAAIRSIRLA